ncbi:lysophospholipid acyltransferase family protein [Aquisediminimonas sediminicola]|uniref:lysophospholipid acyltransferase family protein n=1 Tax=Alteraquisediminimonas sediminicola TaxID=2676787 RepID=UPI001C8D90DF|nr:lysophospholipid acyltransferase family protein [Aquisediminimonas sediminicola]
MRVIAWARIAAILLILLPLFLLHLILRIFTQHTPCPRWFFRLAGVLVGLKINWRGQPLRRHVLYVANHVSWLDILALGGVGHARMVSKAEVRHWPLIGALARLVDTIFVDRSNPAMARAQAGELVEALKEGAPVALFPEGTTGDGIVLRPFKAPLFAALYPPRERAMVQPVALDFGSDAAEIAWIDQEPFGHNAMRILSRIRPIRLTLMFGAPVCSSDYPDRKALSNAMQQAINESLIASASRHHRV